MININNYDQLKKFFIERRGDQSKLPDASMAIPVNGCDFRRFSPWNQRLNPLLSKEYT